MPDRWCLLMTVFITTIIVRADTGPLSTRGQTRRFIYPVRGQGGTTLCLHPHAHFPLCLCLHGTAPPPFILHPLHPVPTIGTCPLPLGNVVWSAGSLPPSLLQAAVVAGEQGPLIGSIHLGNTSMNIATLLVPPEDVAPPLPHPSPDETVTTGTEQGL